jgi:nicotinamidase-related amidase
MAKQRTALIVIDMLNRYEHEDAEPLLQSVSQVVDTIAKLTAAAEKHDLQVVYVNDNYGEWNAGRTELCERALAGSHANLVKPVLPPDGAAFLTKARHSAFYETQLEYLLRHQDVERIVLTGQVTEQCILYTALDGYVRHYSICVPRNAIAHIHPDLAEAALKMMQINMRAHITTAAESLDQ